MPEDNVLDQGSSLIGGESADLAPVEGGQEEVTPTQPEFNPQSYGYKYKGQEHFPRDRNHLMELVSQGHGFNSEIQSIKQRQGEMDEMQQKYGKYEELHNSLQGNPQFANKIWELQQQYQSGNVDGESDPQVLKLQETVSRLENELKTIHNSNADRELQSEIDQLKKQYPDHDWDGVNGEQPLHKRLIQHAMDKNHPDLATAYKDYFWESIQAKAKADALKSQEQDRLKAARGGKVQGGGAKPPQPKAGYQPGDTYNNLTDKAMKMF